MENTLFPVFLKTDHLRFLIVGGGNVGLEKATTLLKQNPKAKIKLVSIAFKLELISFLEAYPQVEVLTKPFDETDLDLIDLAILATDQTQLNQEIKILANQKGILVNAADQPKLCDFYLGSIVNKGNLKIAISTNGKSPVMARRMREYFTEVIPDSIENNINILNRIRNEHKGNFSEKLDTLNRLTSNFTYNTSNNNFNKRYYLGLLIAVIFGFFLAKLF